MRSSFSADMASLILRVGIGGFMLFGHGLSKLDRLMQGWSGGEVKFFEPFGLPSEIGLPLAVFAEVICAGLVIIGFRTRLFVIPILITMAIAAFMANGDSPFWLKDAVQNLKAKEFSLLFLIPLLAIFALGSGRFSLDGLLKRT